MSEKKYAVPEGMLQAAYQASKGHDWIPNPHDPTHSDNQCRQCGAIDCSSAGEIVCPRSHSEKSLLLLTLEAAIRWQAENPQVPSADWALARFESRDLHGRPEWTIRGAATDWLREMYLATELEVPEAVKDLLTTSEHKENARGGPAWRADKHDK